MPRHDMLKLCYKYSPLVFLKKNREGKNNRRMFCKFENYRRCICARQFSMSLILENYSLLSVCVCVASLSNPFQPQRVCVCVWLTAKLFHILISLQHNRLCAAYFCQFLSLACRKLRKKKVVGVFLEYQVLYRANKFQIICGRKSENCVLQSWIDEPSVLPWHLFSLRCPLIPGSRRPKYPHPPKSRRQIRSAKSIQVWLLF